MGDGILAPRAVETFRTLALKVIDQRSARSPVGAAKDIAQVHHHGAVCAGEAGQARAGEGVGAIHALQGGVGCTGGAGTFVYVSRTIGSSVAWGTGAVV